MTKFNDDTEYRLKTISDGQNPDQVYVQYVDTFCGVKYWKTVKICLQADWFDFDFKTEEAAKKWIDTIGRGSVKITYTSYP